MEFRVANPEIEAKLFITGQVDTIHQEALDATLRLIRENKIEPDTIHGVGLNQEENAKELKLGVSAKTITATDMLVWLLAPLPPALTPRDKAIQELVQAYITLQPYRAIEDQVWSQYPPELRTLSNEIKRLQKGSIEERREAEKLLKANPPLFAALRQIAEQQRWMRLDNLAVREALRKVGG